MVVIYEIGRAAIQAPAGERALLGRPALVQALNTLA